MADPSLRERRDALVERKSLRGSAFAQAYAQAADEWLSGLAERAAGGSSRHFALLAVGGYGRAELCPYSDLDVVLVHDGRRNIKAVADAIWYPVWDQGVRLDHSVRRPKEVLEAAGSDLRVALGLLDARLVWGDQRLVETILGGTLERWRSSLGALWLPTLREQMEQRHRSQGEVAFLLEPDLKESHGGLRDAHVLGAIAAYAPRLADQVDLARVGPSSDLLITVRVELHRQAGRELDRLLLQEQDHIAQVLDFADADVLMAAVSEAGRNIAWATEDAWRRQSSWQPAAKQRRLRRERSAHPSEVTRVANESLDAEVEPGIAVISGEAALLPGAAIAEDSSLALRLAALASEMGLPMARSALHRLADHMPPAPDPWPLETRDALIRVLAAGHKATASLEALDQQDLMTRLLPEWGPVRYKPQRNAYHRFTVDRHLLEAAANAADLVDRVTRGDLLMVGALLHDIGKGYSGDHTRAGMELVGRIGIRMGFTEADTETLVSLVRLHLLLPDAATRRDLDDPTTIETVAEAVGDLETLELLAALTEADSLATGPSAWGPWKEGLVAELVERTGGRMEGKVGKEPSRTVATLFGAYPEMIGEVRDHQRPCVTFDPPRVIVAAPDRPGLLSAVAGTLALHGLDVRSADATNDDGVAVEVFSVEVMRGSWPDSARLRNDLESVISGRLVLEPELAAKAKDYAAEPGTRSAHPTGTIVVVDNQASASSTVLEVRAPDEVGLLHRLTQALFDCHLDVVSARASTLGNEVVDAFYVRRSSGGKVTDPDELNHIEDAVQAAVG